MSMIRVALVDDHPVVLAGMRTLLQAAPEITLVGEANSGTDAFRLVTETKPDVAVIDLSLPELSGLNLARQLAVTCPGVKLLALTVHEDRAYVQPLMKAGARGYLLKRSAAEDLVRAIRAVAGGGITSTQPLPTERCPIPCSSHPSRRSIWRSANASKRYCGLRRRVTVTRRSRRGSGSA